MNKVVFDFDKLRGRIREKFKNEKNFARKIEISPTTLSCKLNNITDFTSTEIMKICDKDVLDIPKKDVDKYFFEEKLENNSSLTC